MIKPMTTTAKILTILLVLCLTAALLPAAFASSGVDLSIETTLTAGSEPGSIQLKATNATFNQDPSSDLFSFNNEGKGTLAVTSVTAADGGDTATLTVTGVPYTGEISIVVQAGAFKTGLPEGTATARATVGPASVSVTASGNLTAGVADGTITLQSTGSPFVSSLQESWFTFGGTAGSGLKIKSFGGGGTNDVTLTMDAPTATGDVTLTIAKEAFLYQPGSEVSASSTVTVAVPSGTVSAALDGGATLTAGKDATGTTITLTATGDLVFKEPSFDNFTLGAGSTGLDISGLKRSDDGKTMTLTLRGTPEAQGSFTIEVKGDAFVFPPVDAPLTTNSITINYPTVTLTPEPATIAEGFHGTITLTVDGSLFNMSSTKDNFEISGPGSAGLTLVSVTADADSETATVTLSGEPTATGDLTITAQPAAFKYQPQNPVEAHVTVSIPTGNVTAALNGTLTVNVEATGATITLTADGTLIFADSPATTAFTLGTGSENLSVSGVTRNSDKSVTLALSGTPTTVGSFDVTVAQDAFKYQPAGPIIATPKIPIRYPVIRLTPDPAQFTVGQTTQVTLTAAGGLFVDPLAADLFTISGDGYTGLTVTKVELNAAKNAVTLTLSGAPAQAGSLVLTVDKTAFQNQPENAVSLTIPVVAPTVAPTSTPIGTAPNTGDSAPLALWTGVLALCASGLAAVLLLRRKKHSR